MVLLHSPSPSFLLPPPPHTHRALLLLERSFPFSHFLTLILLLPQAGRPHLSTSCYMGGRDQKRVMCARAPNASSLQRNSVLGRRTVEAACSNLFSNSKLSLELDPLKLFQKGKTHIWTYRQEIWARGWSEIRDTPIRHVQSNGHLLVAGRSWHWWLEKEL